MKAILITSIFANALLLSIAFASNAQSTKKKDVSTGRAMSNSNASTGLFVTSKYKD